MYANIHEAVIEGSDTILLAIPEKDYFLSYESLTLESAQELVDNYFKYRGRDGVPTVMDVDFNSNSRSVKITVDMRYDREFKMLPLDISRRLGDEARE